MWNDYSFDEPPFEPEHNHSFPYFPPHHHPHEIRAPHYLAHHEPYFPPHHVDSSREPVDPHLPLQHLPSIQQDPHIPSPPLRQEWFRGDQEWFPVDEQWNDARSTMPVEWRRHEPFANDADAGSNSPQFHPPPPLPRRLPNTSRGESSRHHSGHGSPQPFRRERRHSASSADHLWHSRHRGRSNDHPPPPPPPRRHSEERRPNHHATRHSDIHQSVFNRLAPHPPSNTAAAPQGRSPVAMPSSPTVSRASVMHRLGPEPRSKHLRNQDKEGANVAASHPTIPTSTSSAPCPLPDLRQELAIRSTPTSSSTSPKLLIRIKQRSNPPPEQATEQQVTGKATLSEKFSHAGDNTKVTSPASKAPSFPPSSLITTSSSPEQHHDPLMSTELIISSPVEGQLPFADFDSQQKKSLLPVPTSQQMPDSQFSISSSSKIEECPTSVSTNNVFGSGDQHLEPISDGRMTCKVSTTSSSSCPKSLDIKPSPSHAIPTTTDGQLRSSSTSKENVAVRKESTRKAQASRKTSKLASPTSQPVHQPKGSPTAQIPLPFSSSSSSSFSSSSDATTMNSHRRMSQKHLPSPSSSSTSGATTTNRQGEMSQKRRFSSSSPSHAARVQVYEGLNQTLHHPSSSSSAKDDGKRSQKQRHPSSTSPTSRATTAKGMGQRHHSSSSSSSSTAATDKRVSQKQSQLSSSSRRQQANKPGVKQFSGEAKAKVRQQPSSTAANAKGSTSMQYSLVLQSQSQAGPPPMSLHSTVFTPCNLNVQPDSAAVPQYSTSSDRKPTSRLGTMDLSSSSKRVRTSQPLPSSTAAAPPCSQSQAEPVAVPIPPPSFNVPVMTNPTAATPTTVIASQNSSVHTSVKHFPHSSIASFSTGKPSSSKPSSSRSAPEELSRHHLGATGATAITSWSGWTALLPASTYSSSHGGQLALPLTSSASSVGEVLSSSFLPPMVQSHKRRPVLGLAHTVLNSVHPDLFHQLHTHTLPGFSRASMLTVLWNSVNWVYRVINNKSYNKESLPDLSDYFAGTISCPVSSPLKLYEEELHHFCRLCGTSVNLWTYHVLRYYTVVFSFFKKNKHRAVELQRLVECLQCVLAELQVPPSFSSLSPPLPCDLPHAIAQELCSPDFIHQLLAIPLPSLYSTTIFAVLFSATDYALASLRNHPSACGAFYSNAMLEYNIGEVASNIIRSPSFASLPSSESLYRQELALLLERCGEDCPLWRCHVLKYWALVRCYPSSSQLGGARSLREKEGKSDLELAELMHRIIYGE